MRARKNAVIYTTEASTNGEEMSKTTTDMDVHESVTEIPAGVFSNCQRLVKVKLPQGLREIGARAFQSCTSLEEFSIPPSVEIIGNEAFFQCKRLKLVVLAEEGRLRTIGKKSFQECGIGLLSIPKSVNTIGESAFEACRNLRLIILREGLQTIGKNAFKQSSNLSEVDIPSTVFSIGEAAFESCRSLQRAGLGKNHRITKIAPRTFQSCVKLGDVSLPTTLTRIDHEAFCYCTSMFIIVFPEGLECIGESAFKHCCRLTEIRIPNSVVSIGIEAFSYCVGLRHVQLGNELRTIGQYAFLSCLCLSGVSFPSSMTKIGESAFASCGCLMGVEFQDDQKVGVGPRVFNRCGSLINISFPSSMSAHIWASAFDECASLERASGGSNFIVQRLKNRFKSHPVHKACYHSSLPALSALRASVAKYALVDGFQMTPFHIAVTAPNLREDILEWLLNTYDFSVLFQRDRNGKTMLDYLLKIRNDRAKDMVNMVLRKGIMESTSGWGLPEWRSKVREAGNQYIRRSEEAFSCATVDSVGKVFGTYVKLESTSLLELGLWNEKIRSLKPLPNQRKRQKIDRDATRYTCGANIVIPHVVEYLGDLPTLTSSMSFW